jgi:hypothetical protein
LFEHVEPKSAERAGAPAAATPASVDLGARVRSLWA